MYTILLWFPLFLLYMASASGVDEKRDDKCIKGQYKSDFVGACVKCPKTLKLCDDQEVGGAYRCYKACRKIVTTPQPTRNLQSTRNAQRSSVPTTPLPPTATESEITTKLSKKLHKPSSKGYPVYNTFKTTLVVNSSSSDSSDKHSDDSKTTPPGKVGGIAVGTVALLLFVAGVFAIYWTTTKNRTRKDQGQKIDYAAVRVDSKSFCNGNNIKLNDFTESHQQTDDEDDKSLTTMASVSREHLEKMPESHV